MAHPIVFDEEVSFVSGKQMHILNNDDFHIYSFSRDKEIGVKTVKISCEQVIESYMFEPDYVFKTGSFSKNARKLQKKIRWHLYGN